MYQVDAPLRQVLQQVKTVPYHHVVLYQGQTALSHPANELVAGQDEVLNAHTGTTPVKGKVTAPGPNSPPPFRKRRRTGWRNCAAFPPAAPDGTGGR